MTLTYACGNDPKEWQAYGYKTYKKLWTGPAGYSSMVSSRDGNTFFILYERGEKKYDETLRLTQVLNPACGAPDGKLATSYALTAI